MLQHSLDPPAITQWCKRLDEHPLPVMPVSGNALREALKRPDAALHDLGTIIASDPVMCLHLLRECQRQFGKRVEGSLSNIHHAVAMLGLDKTLLLAKTFRPLSQPLAQHQGYLDALAQALHSAEQAHHWLAQRAGADQIRLAALLRGIADAALWHFAPREMQALQILIRREAIPAPEAELAVLHCGRPALARALAQQWGFPDSVLDAIDPPWLAAGPYLLQHARRAEQDPRHKLPNRDAAGHLVRSPGLYVHLATELAVRTTQDWENLDVQRCLSVLAACLFLSPGEARQLAQDTALQLSRHWNVPLTAAPACNLVWPRQPRQRRRIKPAQLPAFVARLLKGEPAPAHSKPDMPVATRQPGTTAASATTVRTPMSPAPTARPLKAPVIGLPNENLPADLDRERILNAPPRTIPATEPTHFAGFTSALKKQEFEQFIQRLLTEPDYYSTEYEVIRAVVEALHGCTELVRVVVAIHDPKLDQVEGYFALGCEQFPGLKRYRVRLQPVNLFTHLLKQPAGLWLSPDRPQKATGLIPGSFKQASQTDSCFLMSVFNHRGPYAVFYADRGLNDRAGLSEHEYKIFKTACNACSKHLIARGKRAMAKRGDR